jgi:hypothetical protein
VDPSKVSSLFYRRKSTENNVIFIFILQVFMVFHGIYFQISRTRRSKLVAELFCFIFVSCPAQDPKICDEIRRLLDYGAMNDFVQKLLV